MTFKVERGIPLINSAYGRPAGTCKYPYLEMEIGDSFLVKGLGKKKEKSFRSNTSRAGKVFGRKFTVRRSESEGGLRCWRIE